jgi:peptidoglycan/LPS O-acetylase OafA/YrhL
MDNSMGDKLTPELNHSLTGSYDVDPKCYDQPSVIRSSKSAHIVRKDIEGLRAIAVLAVVLSHMQSSALQGGFVGVDIFFVISGYLIGMHLLQDIQEGRFSFLRFYGRRARRLLPALIVMLVAVWCLGWMILSGPEFADLGKHIVAAAVFANNILLWSQSGYFDAPAATKPLLHLWSLGVEEQFYLLVPFLLWLSSAGRRASIRLVLRLTAVSLLLTLIYAVPSFYLLDTRFWELGVGVAIGYLSLRELSPHQNEQPLEKARYLEFIAISILLVLAAALAYFTTEDPWNRSSSLASSGLVVVFASAVAAIQLAGAYRKKSTWHRLLLMWQQHERPIREVASIAGLALISASLVAISSGGWPGPQTVFPVLGTALVILAGPTALANKALAIIPLVFIGGISYPLYLWHWPAIVFWKMFGFDASTVEMLVPVLCAVLLAWLTKECIEKPARFGRLGAWAVRVPRVGVLITGLLIVGAVGASNVATVGYPARFPPSLRDIANWSMPLPDIDWRRDRCFYRRGVTTEFATECTPPKRPGIRQILLWGDSHAGHLYPGLSSLHAMYDFDLAQWNSAACPPVREPLLGEDSSCASRRAKAMSDINRSAPDIVLLAAAWEMYLAKGTSETAILAAIDDDIGWLKQSGVQRIVLFGPTPTWVTSSDVFMYMLRKRLEKIPERLGGVSNSVRHLDAAMATQAAAEHVEYVSVIDRFCDQTGCRVLGDPNISPPDLLYRDQDHLTPTGSRLLMEVAAPQIFQSH